MKGFSSARKQVFMSLFTLASFALLIALLASSPTVKAQVNQMTIQLNPSSGPVGTPVGLYGLGFYGGTVTVSFNSQDVATTNPGMFSRIDAEFMVPRVSPGVYTVTAKASSGTSARATFTVTAQGSTSGTGIGNTNTGTTTGTISPAGTASIILSTSQANVGTPITVQGSGFGAGSLVTINFQSTFAVQAIADSSGNIKVVFWIPSKPAGFYTVSASTASGVFASQPFTVTTGLSGSGASAGTANGGFWTSINILAVGLVVAAAVIVPVTFMYMRRSRREPVTEEEQPVIQPQVPSYPRAPPTTSTYNRPAGIASRYDQFASYGHPTSHRPQTARTYASSMYRQSAGSSSYSAVTAQIPKRPTSPATYGQPSKSNPQSANTVSCRNCRQTIRADYNICPYCKKKPR